MQAAFGQFFLRAGAAGSFAAGRLVWGAGASGGVFVVTLQR